MPAVVGGAFTGEGDGGVGVDQRVVVEALRGLDGAEAGADRRGDDLLGVAGLLGKLDLLDGVRDGQRGDDGDGPVAYGLDDGVHGVDGDQGAGRVVDEDGGDALGQRLESEVDGLLAGVAAGDDDVVGPLGEGVVVEEVLDLGGAVGGATTTTSETAREAAIARTAWMSMGVPFSARSALGAPGPRRTPRPAAGITTAVRGGRASSDIGCTPAGLFPRPTWVWPHRAGRDALTGPFP